MASFRFTKIKLKESLERLPMLKVLVPIVCGIIFSQYCALPLWFTILGALLCGLLSIILSSSLYTLMLLFFGGITALELTLQSPTPPLNKLLIAELQCGVDVECQTTRCGVPLATSVAPRLKL